MFYFFTDYPSTSVLPYHLFITHFQDDYLCLNTEGLTINATFVIKEEFFIEDEEIDLSILYDDDDNFEKKLEERLQQFVESTRPKDPLVLEEERRL